MPFAPLRQFNPVSGTLGGIHQQDLIACGSTYAGDDLDYLLNLQGGNHCRCGCRITGCGVYAPFEKSIARPVDGGQPGVLSEDSHELPAKTCYRSVDIRYSELTTSLLNRKTRWQIIKPVSYYLGSVKEPPGILPG